MNFVLITLMCLTFSLVACTDQVAFSVAEESPDGLDLIAKTPMDSPIVAETSELPSFVLPADAPLLDPKGLDIPFATAVPIVTEDSNVAVLAKLAGESCGADSDCRLKAPFYGAELHVLRADNNGHLSFKSKIVPREAKYIVQHAMDGSDLVILTANPAESSPYPYVGEFSFSALELYRQNEDGDWIYSGSLDLKPSCPFFCDYGSDFVMAGSSRILSVKKGRVLLNRQRYSWRYAGGMARNLNTSINQVQIFAIQGTQLEQIGAVNVASEQETELYNDTTYALEQGENTFALVTSGLSHYGYTHIFAFNANGSASLIRKIPDGCFNRGTRNDSQRVAYNGDRLYSIASNGVNVYDTTPIGVTKSKVISQAGSYLCESSVKVARGNLYVLSVQDFNSHMFQTRSPRMSIFSLQNQTETQFRSLEVGKKDYLSLRTGLAPKKRTHSYAAKSCLASYSSGVM